MPLLAIIVLNYNGCEDTLACLTSLSGLEANIILVDNGSTDGTVATVRRDFPRVSVLEMGVNLGYTGGMNAGIQHAQDTGAEYICVLNNDTTAEADTFDILLSHCAGRPDVAISPRIDYADGSGVWFAGGMLDRKLGWPVHLSVEAANLDRPFSSDLLTGCCLMASAATWRTVGSFDDAFFLNFEDSDWSMRARSLGVRLEIVPRALLRHGVSRSFASRSDLSLLGTYYFLRNALLFQRRYLRWQVGRLRFLRVHLIAGLWHDVRGGRLDRAVLRVLAIRDYFLRRFGPAGGAVLTVAERRADMPPEVATINANKRA